MTEAESKQEKPNWIKITPADMEKLVVEIAKEEKGSKKIGLILRDKHGIPKAKLIGKSITDILNKHKITYKQEDEITNEKIKNLETHIIKNKHDNNAKKSLMKTKWMLIKRK